MHTSFTGLPYIMSMTQTSSEREGGERERGERERGRGERERDDNILITLRST